MKNRQIEYFIHFITIFVSIAALCISLFYSHITEERESRMEYLTYTANSTKGNYMYSISNGTENISIPAPTLLLNFKTGIPAYITVMTYESDSINILGTFQPKETKSGYTVAIDSSPQEYPLLENNIVYDYYFLYLQPLSGEPVLDLICNKINLQTQTSETQVYHRIDLLGDTQNTSSAFSKMISDYAKIYEKISELPSI